MYGRLYIYNALEIGMYMVDNLKITPLISKYIIITIIETNRHTDPLLNVIELLESLNISISSIACDNYCGMNEKQLSILVNKISSSFMVQMLNYMEYVSFINSNFKVHGTVDERIVFFKKNIYIKDNFEQWKFIIEKLNP